MDHIVPFPRERRFPYDDYDYCDDDSHPPYDEPVGYGSAGLGECTRITVIDDRVVDVQTIPVSRTPFESVARELGRGLPRPQPRPAPPPQPPAHEQTLVWLAQVVGGEESLLGLDCEPLPEEPLDLAQVPEDLRPRAQEVGMELARVTDLILGKEARTASYRLLADVLAREPSLVRTDRGAQVVAAATLYAVAKANDLIGAGRTVPVGLLSAMYDLKTQPTDLARRMAHTVAPHGPIVSDFRTMPWSGMFLGSERYLVSSFREGLASARDSALRLRSVTPVVEDDDRG